MTPLLAVNGLVKEYVVPGGTWRKQRLRALDGVDLQVHPGTVVGLVGESGSGKSTLARCALGLTKVDDGAVTYDGVDVSGATGAARRRLRREIQLVFQHPVAALNPRLTVEALVAEPLTTHHLAHGAALRARVDELLESVGLRTALRDRLPHELSGGQAQRVVIARALATGPRLLVLDEPTASLDVIVQAQILNLLVELQTRYEIAYLLISHDLSVVRHLSDSVFVLYLGRVVESGPARDVLAAPRHPYTQALLASMRGGGRSTLDGPPRLPGEAPPAWEIPAGCRFHPRCAVRLAYDSPPACTNDDPRLEAVGPGHAAACHLADVAARDRSLSLERHPGAQPATPDGAS